METLQFIKNGVTYYITNITRTRAYYTIALTHQLASKQCKAILNYERHLIDNVFTGTDMQVSHVNVDEAMQRGMRIQPLCKAIPDSEFAAKYFVKPWEHIRFMGSIVVFYIWDTREITKVLPIDKLTNEDYECLCLEYSDNGKSLNVGDDTMDELRLVKDNMDIASTITDEQFSMIRK